MVSIFAVTQPIFVKVGFWYNNLLAIRYSSGIEWAKLV